MGSALDTPFWSKKFYDHKARWINYFKQIQFVAGQIRKRGGKIESFQVLEVGPSYGLVTFYLRKFGVNLKTLDVKEEYKPDFLASVLKMPLLDNSFDVVIICEVLEHLPFDDFPKALQELHRVTKGAVFLSLPDVRHILLNLDIKIPFFKKRNFLVKIPTFKKHSFNGHYWEIGKRGYSVSRIRQEITKAGFRISMNRVFSDTPKNHYFVLEK